MYECGARTTLAEYRVLAAPYTRARLGREAPGRERTSREEAPQKRPPRERDCKVTLFVKSPSPVQVGTLVYECGARTTLAEYRASSLAVRLRAFTKHSTRDSLVHPCTRTLKPRGE